MRKKLQIGSSSEMIASIGSDVVISPCQSRDFPSIMPVVLFDSHYHDVQDVVGTVVCFDDCCEVRRDW